MKIYLIKVKNIIPNFMEIRKYDLDYYFQFFEILTKNTFYVYENDEEGKKYRYINQFY